MKPLLLLATIMSVTTMSFANVDPKPASISKTFVFPVAGKKNNIGSFWGASREGGKRKHEGIDIFAKKGTPVVAIFDGIIVSRTATPKGGKVLWLRSAAHGLSAYYAHLDQQKVRVGQFVKKGQVLGTVGNTGNAKYTPSHLHFGIYTWKGAVNPLPYVKSSPKIALPASGKKAQTAIAKGTSKRSGLLKTTTTRKAMVVNSAKKPSSVQKGYSKASTNSNKNLNAVESVEGVLPKKRK